jgi:inosine-uridine nucleoside N-ribohydrolase
VEAQRGGAGLSDRGAAREAAIAAAAREAVPGPPRVLLDCDPGHDDAIAILLAAGRRDGVDLRAVTTVAGNAELDKVTLNARRVMTLAGLRDVPVAAGAAAPRSGKLITALEVHGQTGLDGAELPEPAVALDPRGAVELMRDRGPATVVATGPLTNVAALLERAPEAVTEIVWMGGSTGRGNARPYAEFNALVDPEAAEIVFSSGVPLTMVGLNLTHQAQATGTVIERLHAVGNPAAEAALGWLAFFAGTYSTVYGFEGPPVHDPCALALVIDSSLVRTVDAFVAIETAGRWTRGATVVDLHGRLGRGPNARVAMALDVPRFWDLVVEAIAAL